MNGNFNARIMWRVDGALENYIYYAGEEDTSKCGDSWLWGASASSAWQHVKVYMRMNDLGAHVSIMLHSATAFPARCATLAILISPPAHRFLTRLPALRTR